MINSRDPTGILKSSIATVTSYIAFTNSVKYYENKKCNKDYLIQYNLSNAECSTDLEIHNSDFYIIIPCNI